jgi:hypothetical protein
MDDEIAKTGMDPASVIQWNGRPKRARKPPPKTYWDEYVATDAWYLRELTADVPDDELKAALEDEDWVMAEAGEEGEDESELDGEEEDADYSSESEEESDGGDFEDEGSDTITDSVSCISECESCSTYSPRSPSYSPPATPRFHRSPEKPRQDGQGL